MTTFISRIDGSAQNRADFPPTINENNGIITIPEGETIPNIFKTADDITHEKAAQLTIRLLSREWNIDHKLLEKIAYHFYSVDESEFFIDTLDANDWDLTEGWQNYCRSRSIEHEMDCNPFN